MCTGTDQRLTSAGHQLTSADIPLTSAGHQLRSGSVDSATDLDASSRNNSVLVCTVQAARTAQSTSLCGSWAFGLLLAAAPRPAFPRAVGFRTSTKTVSPPGVTTSVTHQAGTRCTGDPWAPVGSQVHRRFHARGSVAAAWYVAHARLHVEP